MPMLHMQDVVKSYRTDLVQTRALDHVTLEIEAGEFVAVSGPSGSGKTTFLNVTGLLDTFDGGTYHLDGVDVSRLGDLAQSRIRNEKIGFVFQGFNLIPDLDVFDNVDVPLRYRGLSGKDRKRRIEEGLEKVGLSGRKHHLPSQLSGGQQQRVAIARALAGDPKLILADEPTGLGHRLRDHGATGAGERSGHDHRDGDPRSGMRRPRPPSGPSARRTSDRRARRGGAEPQPVAAPTNRLTGRRAH